MAHFEEKPGVTSRGGFAGAGAVETDGSAFGHLLQHRTRRPEENERAHLLRKVIRELSALCAQTAPQVGLAFDGLAHPEGARRIIPALK